MPALVAGWHQLVFVESRGSQDALIIVSADEVGRRVVLEGIGPITCADWLDAEYIVFDLNQDGARGLYPIDRHPGLAVLPRDA